MIVVDLSRGVKKFPEKSSKIKPDLAAPQLHKQNSHGMHALLFFSPNLQTQKNRNHTDVAWLFKQKNSQLWGRKLKSLFRGRNAHSHTQIDAMQPRNSWNRKMYKSDVPFGQGFIGLVFFDAPTT